MDNSSSELEQKVNFLPFINYESIVCAKFKDTEQKINAACMGVHFTSTNEVFLHILKDTHSHDLLKPGSIFAINFSENFEEYVIAGLKQYGPEEREDELPRSAFKCLDPAPILKSSWIAIFCEVIPMPVEFLQKPPCRRRQEPNVRARIIKQEIFHFPQIFNNRSMNLALEALINVNRIPSAQLFSSESQLIIDQYVNIKKKLISWRDMDRFENSFQRMDNYLLKHGIKPQDLFDI